MMGHFSFHPEIGIILDYVITYNLRLSIMMKTQQHYSPFSPSARKWMIAIGSIAIAVTLLYALSSGVISYLNY